MLSFVVYSQYSDIMDFCYQLIVVTTHCFYRGMVEEMSDTNRS